MTIKITSKNFKSDVFRRGLTTVLLLSYFGAFAQNATITDISPTRITKGSKVTITGTDFTNTTRSNISVNNITIDDNSRTLVNAEVMTFMVSETSTIDITGGIVTIGGGVTASKTLDFIAPTSKRLARGEPYFVEEIYTNWKRGTNNFWRSNEWVRDGTINNDPNSPNDNHELLGYKSNGVIYSTGVDDELLEEKLNLTPGSGYKRGVFKAYSTNGVQGKTVGGMVGTYIIAADALDGLFGNEESAADDISSFDNINGLKVFDAIIDGKHGLNLGIGITNFNNQTSIQFFSGNGQPGVIGDDTPDLLITQVADADVNKSDIYFYADESGNIVGRPIDFSIQEFQYNEDLDTRLSVWQIDLYQFAPGVDFNIATPSSRIYAGSPNNIYKPLRMAAFNLEDFGITDQAQVDVINSINMNAGGSADMAFLAYNQGTFNLKSPVGESLLSKFVCRVVEEGGNTSITFELVEGGNVGIEDDATGNIRGPIGFLEALTYEWSRYNTVVQASASAPDGATLTISGVDRDDLGTYKVKISNGQGTIVLPVDLSEGGTPYYWDGTWSHPYGEVDPEERGLVFNSDYTHDEPDDLEGCDCVVKPEADVIIPENKMIKLFGSLIVEPALPDSPEVPGGLSAGTFTLENNASLIQTKEVTTNENSGNIIAKRKSQELKKYDFVYWSSPVNDGKFESISGGGLNNVYQWDVNFLNENNGTRGNWVRPSGEMVTGRGYIKRENSQGVVEAKFNGVPNNGEITIQVKKTPDYLPISGFGTDDPMKGNDKHSNLIGNPYPSAINAITFLEKNEDVLDGKVLIWDSNIRGRGDGANNPFYENFKYNYSDQYITYNKTGTSDPEGFNGYIASGQGFIVKVLPAATELNVKFDNSMRFGAGYDNSEFLRSSDLSTSTEKQLIWLALVNENSMASNILVGYAEGATNGKDHMYDAVSGSGGMRIYSILDDSDLLIQGRALPFQDSDEVPLGVELLNNGIYKIGIAQVKGSLVSDAAQGIYLEDTYNNIIHDLRKTPYSFTGIAGNIKDRFILRYTNTTLSVDGPQLSDTFVYVKNDQLHVKASKNIERVVVYDLSGKKLMDHKVNGNTDAIQTAFQFPKGIYLTEIKLETVGTITKKIMN